MKKYKCILLMLPFALYLNCVTERQKCYSDSSESLKNCLLTYELSKESASSKVDPFDILVLSCLPYITKELSCPGENNAIPLSSNK